jgi:hypothetical protein
MADHGEFGAADTAHPLVRRRTGKRERSNCLDGQGGLCIFF